MGKSLTVPCKATYDPEVNALYITLFDDGEKPTLTSPLSDTVIIDLNSDRQILGIEILDFIKKAKKKKSE